MTFYCPRETAKRSLMKCLHQVEDEENCPLLFSHFLSNVCRFNDIFYSSPLSRLHRSGSNLFHCFSLLVKELMILMSSSPSFSSSSGIGFFVGEPCMDTLQCNPILFNVYCNQSTGRCECTSEFPVNIYNRVCVKGEKKEEAIFRTSRYTVIASTRHRRVR